MNRNRKFVIYGAIGLSFALVAGATIPSMIPVQNTLADENADRVAKSEQYMREANASIHQQLEERQKTAH